MTNAADWRGRVGDVWAEEYVRTERAFSGIAAALDVAIDAIAPQIGRAADLGCGVGSTTFAVAAARPGLRITGIDLSAALIAVARRRAEMITNGAERSEAGAVTFATGDVVPLLPTLAPLDLLVSRHGLMFFDDPVPAFAALRAASVTGAPLIFSCFAARTENDWLVTPRNALGLSQPIVDGYEPGPFAFADGEFVRALLDQGGWDDVQITRQRVDYPVGGGMDPIESALDFYRRIGPLAPFLAASQAPDRARHETMLRDLFASRIQGGMVTFSAAIQIVTARAGKEVA
ncbi:class I SAM-dependent methyltransferase [Sphingomonas sp. NPDC079357]|uniref:class I SAM-dependent methyltransferase n=1 Tax=Sphingomonas sp. NPDC079357 TaxID=3364518 RepID=UPI00384C0EC2